MLINSLNENLSQRGHPRTREKQYFVVNVFFLISFFSTTNAFKLRKTNKRTRRIKEVPTSKQV